MPSLKSLLAIGLAGSFALVLQTTTPAHAASTTIRDLGSSSDYARSAIQRLAAQSIITGDTSGDFHPQTAISRAEMAAMLVRTLKLPTAQADHASSFTDVPKGTWAHPYVETAKQYGIINGTGPNTFDPTQKLSREQMATMFTRALGLTGQHLKGLAASKIKGDKPLLDVYADKNRITAYAQDPVTFAVYQQIMNGIGATTFSPQGEAKREQVAVVTDRFLTNKSRLQNTADAFRVASSATIITEPNSVTFTFEEPVRFVDIGFTDNRVRYEYSPPLDYMNPITSDRYVSSDRKTWVFARNFDRDQPQAIDYRVRLYNGDDATFKQDFPAPKSSELEVSSVQVLSPTAIAVNFTGNVKASTLTPAAFHVEDGDYKQNFVTSIDAQASSATLHLHEPLQTGQRLKVSVMARQIASASKPEPDPSGEVIGDIDWAAVQRTYNETGVDVTKEHICPMECLPDPRQTVPRYWTTYLIEDAEAQPPVATYLPEEDRSNQPYIIDEHRLSETPTRYLDTAWSSSWSDLEDLRVVSGDRLISITDRLFVNAINPATGERDWYYNNAYPYSHTNLAAATTDHLFINSGENKNQLLSLSATDGTFLWKKQLDAPVQAIDVQDGKDYVLTAQDLIVYDAISGEEIWRNPVSDGTALRVRNNQIAIGTQTGELIGFTLDGTTAFASQAVSKPITSITYANETWLLLQDNILSAYTTAGIKTWSKVFLHDLIGDQIAADGNSVYATFHRRDLVQAEGESNVFFGVHKSYIQRLDLQNGSVLAERDLFDVAITPPVISQGKVYTAGYFGYLLINNSDTLQSEDIFSGTPSRYYADQHEHLYLTAATPHVFNNIIIVLKQEWAGNMTGLRLP